MASPATFAALALPTPQTGDILFFTSSGSLEDTLITRATGIYVHCEIVVSPATDSIGALARGVTRHAIPPDGYAALAQTGATLEPDRLAHALGWLGAKVGERYGWWDIFSDALGLFLPRRDTPVLVFPSRLDCSDLASRFLLQAGYRWLTDDIVDDPTRVSPSQLAAALAPVLHGTPTPPMPPTPTPVAARVPVAVSADERAA